MNLEAAYRTVLTDRGLPITEADVASHKTFITDRGPPTVGDGIVPKQVVHIVSVLLVGIAMGF